MKLILLSVLLAYFYTAKAELNRELCFINEDCEFSCKGKDGNWFLANVTKITQQNPKFSIIQDENESKLVIKNFNPRDSSLYRCATDQTNQVFNVRYFYPQTVTQNTETVVVSENGHATLRCESHGTQIPVTYTWMFKNKELTNDNDVVISAGVLSLRNIKRSQAGKYSCRVEQTLETNRNTQELFFQLIVTDQKLSYKQPSKTVVREQESAEFKCVAKGLGPDSKYSWYLNNEILVDETSNVISLSNIQSSQAGKYVCKITKSSGLHEEIEHELIVEYAPIFLTNFPTVVEVKLGQTKTLACAVDAVPTPQFRWLKNNLEIFRDIDTYNLKSYLIINADSSDDFTTYTCDVQNEVAMRSLKFKVNEIIEATSPNSVEVFEDIPGLLDSIAKLQEASKGSTTPKEEEEISRVNTTPKREETPKNDEASTENTPVAEAKDDDSSDATVLQIPIFVFIISVISLCI